MPVQRLVIAQTTPKTMWNYMWGVERSKTLSAMYREGRSCHDESARCAMVGRQYAQARGQRESLIYIYIYDNKHSDANFRTNAEEPARLDLFKRESS